MSDPYSVSAPGSCRVGAGMAGAKDKSKHHRFMNKIPNGATFVKVDKILNVKDNSPALLFHGSNLLFKVSYCLVLLFIGKVGCVKSRTSLFWTALPDVAISTCAYAKMFELCPDDGGGMDPEGIRKCMSLGYSSKKSNNTIGQ
ncbi:Protein MICRORCHIDIA 2, partial [Bienertia sinuspersici]